MADTENPLLAKVLQLQKEWMDLNTSFRELSNQMLSAPVEPLERTDLERLKEASRGAKEAHRRYWETLDQFFKERDHYSSYDAR